MAVALEQTATLGEVRVETGTGLVTELKHEAGKRNAQLVIKATHADLRQPITGWVDTADSGVWPLAQQAHAEHFEIEYRIEVKRKHGVPLDTPIAKLTNTDKVRDVAALARKGELSQLDRVPDTAKAPQEPESAADDTEPAPDPAPPATAPTSPPRRPRIEEGKPWELYNSDHSLNLASYSYQATAEVVEVAHRLITRLDAETRENGGEVPEFRMGRVTTLAKMLLDAADHVQAATRADGRVDRMDGSHRRARYAVRAALDVHPVPWGAEPEDRATWLKDLIEHATGILAIASDLFHFHETGAPR